MMFFKASKSGGRIFQCDLPHGKARVEWDASGKLVSESLDQREPAPPREAACVHLGDPTGTTVQCNGCKGKVALKVFACSKHGECFTGKTPTGAERSCKTCGDYAQ